MNTRRPKKIDAGQVVEAVSKYRGAKIIAIDGLPCSGKSTLATRVRDIAGFECIHLDEFALPTQHWPHDIGPAFPFRYIRYGQFLEAVRLLKSTGSCTYRTYDWEKDSISANSRTVELADPVVVEGVSALNSAICDLYDTRIFVKSDPATALSAAIDRAGDGWAHTWRSLFMPSVDIYMATTPSMRADLIVEGRMRH
ncbi:MAG: hypothetical protein AAF414_14515 [Pseudomonadota bacterium]